jgi:CheY-like chemotaxis protein
MSAAVGSPDDCRTVLVVDDNEGIRESLIDVLDIEGYVVVTAEHGAEALAKLRNGVRPCVILLDLMMPVMNGADFRHAQRQDAQLAQIPVVLISADGDLIAKAAELQLPFIAKPMKIDRVFAAVAQYCK